MVAVTSPLQQRIAETVAPNGFTRFIKPLNSRSPVYKYGATFQHKTETIGAAKTPMMAWKCCVVENCDIKTRVVQKKTDQEGFVIYGQRSTSAVVLHLKQHGIHSGKTAKTESNRKRLDDSVAKQMDPKGLYKNDRQRFEVLTSVQNINIANFSTFNHWEKEHIKRQMLINGKPGFPIDKLSNKAVKHTIAEIYDAFSNTRRATYRRVLTPRITNVSANIDIWMSKLSGGKYVGVRIWYITHKFELVSEMLAIKPYKPAAEVVKSTEPATKASAILQQWFLGVLDEYGISGDQIFSTVTDSGSDVKRCCDVLMDSSEWEWCIPHMLNTALVEAFGAHEDPKKVKDSAKPIREFIKRVRKVVTHLNKSTTAEVCFDEIQQDLFGHSTVSSIHEVVVGVYIL